MTDLGGVWSWLTTAAHWSGPDGLGQRLVQHLVLTGIAVGMACLIALPIGIALGHLGRGGVLAVNLGNIGRAIPVVAVMACSARLRWASPP